MLNDFIYVPISCGVVLGAILGFVFASDKGEIRRSLQHDLAKRKRIKLWQLFTILIMPHFWLTLLIVGTIVELAAYGVIAFCKLVWRYMLSPIVKVLNKEIKL